jgi:hypothetical protein
VGQREELERLQEEWSQLVAEEMEKEVEMEVKEVWVKKNGQEEWKIQERG